jgi:hypothetical protein
LGHRHPVVKSDSPINRTKPGLGGPPLWWKHRFTRYEWDAAELIGLIVVHENPSSVRQTAMHMLIAAR